MALSKIQKAQMSEFAFKSRQAKNRAVAAVGDKYDKAKKSLGEERKIRKGESVMTGVGTVAAGAVASQVHREIAVKRGSPMISKLINYGAGAIGILVAVKARPSQSGARVLGSSMAGMAAGQAALDLQFVDLVPGLND